MQIVLATKNRGKIAEFQKIFANSDIQLLSLDDIGFYQEIIEDGDSFFSNALLKAQAVYNYAKRPVIADDSGLCCDGLDGKPGIFSARYGGELTDERRRKKLLKDMEKINNRQAHFHCSIIFWLDNNHYQHVEGDLAGEISYLEKGHNGFGYDPIFYLPKVGLTLAEMSIEEKNQISHRAIALQKFKEYVKNDFSN